MRFTTGTTDFRSEKPCVITLGKFDGMHKGHMKLLDWAIDIARAKEMTSVVFTFEVSPYTLTKKAKKQVILTNPERKRLLEQTDLDWLIECPFDQNMMRMEPEIFVEELLVNKLKAHYVVVGNDFRFGYQRKGDAHVLSELGKRYGFYVEVLDKETYKDEEISSTRIRDCIQRGQMEDAAEMLGYPYFFEGEVIEGRQIGRSLGIPTANMVADEGKIIPPFGVYATRNTFGGVEFGGVTNIGVKPTVQEKFVGIETHLFSCNMNLYGKQQKVEFLRFQRPEKKFPSLEALKSQILSDEEEAKKILKKKG